MKLDAGQLEQNGYVLKEKLPFNELTVFVKQYLSKTNAATVFFLIINIVFFALLAFRVAMVAVGKVNGAAYVFSFLGGVVLLMALIPVHELIHAMAYRLCGAKKISFTVNLKSFVFLTVADKFVASRGEFMVILLAPFTVISISLIVAYFVSGPYLQCTVTSALVLHTFACSGDFGLASYFLAHDEDVIVTYDDRDENNSYFFQQVRRS